MSLFPPDEWVTVGQSQLEIVAEMMRSRLEAEGIDAVLRGNKASGAAGVINELNISWNNPLGGVEVRVHQSDAETARKILAEVGPEEQEEYGGDKVDGDEREPVLAESKDLQSGLSLYFQIFLCVSIVLFVLPPVTLMTQNPRLGLVIGIIAAIAFLLYSRRPRK